MKCDLNRVWYPGLMFFFWVEVNRELHALGLCLSWTLVEFFDFLTSSMIDVEGFGDEIFGYG